LYQACMTDYVDDDDTCRASGGMSDWQEKRKYSKKTCPSAALSNKGSAYHEPSWIPGLRGGKPATNSPELRHRPVFCVSFIFPTVTERNINSA
jgi:hypothetical protein